MGLANESGNARANKTNSARKEFKEFLARNSMEMVNPHWNPFQVKIFDNTDTNLIIMAILVLIRRIKSKKEASIG